VFYSCIWEKTYIYKYRFWTENVELLNKSMFKNSSYPKINLLKILTDYLHITKVSVE